MTNKLLVFLKGSDYAGFVIVVECFFKSAASAGEFEFQSEFFGECHAAGQFELKFTVRG